MAAPATPPVSSCRLPLTFAADDLARDLAAIPPDAWVAHFNAGYHDGGWSGVALRGIGGDAGQLFPGHAQTASHADTPLLARCPRIGAALARLLCPVGPVRLLRLSAGGLIREHRDDGLCLEHGLARLHIPILTGRDVEFYLGGDLVTMAPGECWYLNFDLPHRVQNLGTTDRVHLVIDCEVNDWLRDQILTTATGDTPPNAADRDSARTRFDRFRALVLDDPVLTQELWSIEQPDQFVERVLLLGRQHGFRFTPEDIAAAMRQGARIAAGRWIVV
jgi:Aspartyl/Asparaginyl beta-hydroxylase